LSESGPKYGPKHVAVINKTNANNEIGSFFIVVLTARIAQILRVYFAENKPLLLSLRIKPCA
jgi:hypothetical protein